MKLTAAIAMNYPNSEVTMNGYDDPIFKIDEFTLMRVSSGDIFHEPIGRCQLILTPLSKISDEDAVELGELSELFGVNDNPSDSDRKLRLTEGKAIVQGFIEDSMFSSIDYSNRYAKEYINTYLSSYDPRRMIKFIDYLRSKSYDIDNLIAAGVAVEKTH